MTKNIIVLTGICICLLIACKPAVKSTNEVDRSVISEEDAAAELYQNYKADPTDLFEKEENALIEYAMNNGITAVGTPSGLYYQIEDIGSGDFLKHGDQVRAHYKGMFLDGKEFDSSYKRGEPLSFKVGQMMKGWNEGLSFMKRGDKAVFLIPSKLGYGERGFPGYVPPNTPMVFELEVLVD
jgi:FKBP-type peptidyl-prolyl cis-trans isomerase FkpA/FKBP-type peptidyl-prolyl cis-trans isomerase FklB